MDILFINPCQDDSVSIDTENKNESHLVIPRMRYEGMIAGL